MNRVFLCVAVTLLASVSAFGAEKKSDKKRDKKAVATPIEQVVQPAAVDSVIVAETAAEPEIDKQAYNKSLTIDYTLFQIDSLLSVWRERAASDSFEAFFQNYIDPESESNLVKSVSMPADSVLSRRLIDMVSPINLPYNDVVRSYISRYANNRYGTMGRIISLSQYYFPMLEQELINSGLPVEFRAMPIIESALISTARSPMGAMGLWQFMPSTGKAYGLEINSLVDQRCDPVASTKAACRFLKDLYNIYGDWSLVIAAYNCGPGNVNKAMARSGVKEGTFWDIYYFLPRETRGYVPAFIGASYAYAYHRQHGIEVNEPPIPLATDTIHVNRLLHLGQVSEVLDLPMSVLRALNPQYRKDIIPATTKEYVLTLPQRYVVKYIEQEPEIHAKDSLYLKEYISPEVVRRAQNTMGGAIHVVKSGDTLSAIAKKYRVTVRQIMNWNGLRSADRLSIGQKLRIEAR